MAEKLNVYIHDKQAGQLTSDTHGNLYFQYCRVWLNQEKIPVLSKSLPPQEEPFGPIESKPFFAGFLPEQNQRRSIAKKLGISEKNDYRLLELIGGECAGAVTILPEGMELPNEEHILFELSQDSLEDILKSPASLYEIDNEKKNLRLSLAGAQQKIALHINQNGDAFLPMGNSVSTHILKPAMNDVKDSVFNEALCLNLGREIGLNIPSAEFKSAGKIDYLQIERYDRTYGSDGKIQRLHQEDFCQALGIVSEHKYQNEGGPSIPQCFQLIREITTIPAKNITPLLDAIIFNFLIGNNDAHGKNFSILYRDSGTTIAPFYDLLCTSIYPEFSNKMAMKIGSKYDSADVYPSNFEDMAIQSNLSSAAVLKQILKVAHKVHDKAEVFRTFHSSSPKLVDVIQKKCERTIKHIELSRSKNSK